MGVLFKLLYLSSFVMKQQWFFFPPEAFFSQNTECQTAKAHLQEIHCTPNNAQTLNGDDNASEFAIGKKSQFSEMWNTFQWKGRSLYLTVSQYSKLECASYCLHTTLSETDPSVSFSQARAMFPNAHLWAPERLLFSMMIQISVAKWNTVHLAKYWPSPTTISP